MDIKNRRYVIVVIGCLGLLLIVGPQESSCNAFSNFYRGAVSFFIDPEPFGGSPLHSRGRSAGDDDTTTSRPNPTKATQVKSEKSEADEIKDDFESQCLVSRKASMQRAPQVFFFSSVNHDESNFGCVANTVISLGLDDSGADFGDDPNDWKMDTEMIREVLVGSGSYNKTLPSYLLVHGFLASWDGDAWMCSLKDRILNESRANVFIVDWSGGSKPMLPMDYGAAVGNTKYVGQLLAKFILTLLRMTNQSDAARFHLIGHSLGAHICGFVGYSLGSTSLGRITGLDPAGPCFTSGFGQNSTQLSATGELSGGRKRLSAQSANLVMAIHTDAGRFGLDENCGHYDIYVNGGSSQPTCVGQSITDRVGNLLNLRLVDAVNIWDIACPHGYSHQMTKAYLPMVYKTLFKSESATSKQRKHRHEFDLPEKQCYLMAHRCASWTAYKRGECGLVAQGRDFSHTVDALAMDPELDARKQAAAATEAAYWHPIVELSNENQTTQEQEGKDDEHTNGDDQVKDEDLEQQSSGGVPGQKVKESVTRYRQHYIKTSRSKSASICAFTYQMVIAAEPASDGGTGGKLYVEIPLDKEPGLRGVRSGGKIPDRLVRISHRVARNSWAYAQLSKAFESLSENSGQLDYFTALITFDAASRSECRKLVKSNSSETISESWYLCQAISNIDGARLWSSDEQALSRVRMVAMAYLSGSNSTIRRGNSYLLEPDSNIIEEGEPKHAATKMLRNDRKGLLNQMLGGFQGGVQCLTSVLNPFQDSSCGDGGGYGANLKYSVPLKVVTDDNKRQALQT